MSEETKEQTKTAGCGAGDDFVASCEQMKKIMGNCRGDQKEGFDPAAMMAKMKGCCTQKK